MMMVPLAANMPPTPWQTEILASGIWGDAAHLAHALLQRVHAVHARMHVGEAAAIGVERKLAARACITRCDEFAGLFMRHEAEVAEAEQRQMRKGVVDHQMVDVLMCD